MATLENTELGRQVVEEAKRYVLHSWSVQSLVNPIPVAGAEGRYFWDYDGKRYLDFASQLVNLALGHQHPKLVAAIKEAVAYCNQTFDSMTDAKGSEMTQFRSFQLARLTILSLNTAHTDEHYGNMVTYMRLKGIVPPTSENQPAHGTK